MYFLTENKSSLEIKKINQQIFRGSRKIPKGKRRENKFIKRRKSKKLTIRNHFNTYD
jgi:hypothetical protein